MPDRSLGRWSPPVWLVIGVLSLCGTVVSLMQTLVVPLLPDLPRLLDTTARNASWLVTSTLLTSAVATPIVSKLADMFGKRLMMLVSLATMIVGSVIGALGDSLGWLVLARSLQGFAPALIPVGISIMRDELPRDKVPAAVALMSATLGVGAAIGLPLAGVIYAHADWHLLFWVSASMGLVMLVAVPLVVSESEVRTRGRFDFVGAILLSAALTLLLLAISKGGHWGWLSEPTLASLIGAALLLAAWVPWELRASQPLVDVRTSSRRPVLLTNCASVLVGFAMYGNMISTTQLLQVPKASGYGLGLTVLGAGLSMLPAGLVMVAMAPVTAAMTKRYGAKVSLIAGALILAAGYIGRVFLIEELWQIIVGAAVVSVGTAMAYAAMPTLIMAAVPITETAAANGLNTLLRSVGTSTSSASVAALLAAATVELSGVRLPTVDAFQHVFWIAAFAALASAGVAVALPGRPSAEVERARPAAPEAPGVPRGQERVRERELVVRGAVVREDDQPVRHAVVSVLRISGEQVDWSRADNDGAWSVVLPEPGRYLVVSSADGWAPCSQVVELTDADAGPRLRLAQRLTVSGRVTAASRPAAGMLVSLTRHSGEAAGSTHTGAEGRYELPLPPAGRYVLTALEPRTEQTRSVQILVGAQSREADIELSPALAENR